MLHQKKINKYIPNGEIEKTLFQQGLFRISGVDEVGRGAFAGPILACAVSVAESRVIRELVSIGVKDSKMLSEKKREEVFILIKGLGSVIGWSISKVEAFDIDDRGLSYANNLVLEKAVVGLVPAPDYVLVDGFYINNISMKQEKIIKGEQKSVLIATASIIAKVTRDRHMRELATQYPKYGFALHKGYGTAKHIDALRSYGYSPEHRRSFYDINKK